MEVSKAMTGEQVHERVADDSLRAALRGMWATAAAGWSEHAEYVDARGAGITRAMLDGATPGRGDRVLELACGPGGVGLAAAARVGPGGSVVLSDAVAAMTAIAAERAAGLGLTNVTTVEVDLEHIDQPDATYDAVLCREGLMLTPDPGRALREIRRVLLPAGRAAVAVWGQRARNPWLGVLFDAVTAHTGAPVPPPGIPGPFSLGDAGTLAGLLTGAQLTDVVVSEVSVPLRATSFDEWFTTVPALAGPIAAVLASLPDDAIAAIRAHAERALAPYAGRDGYDIPGVSLVAAGRRG
jgi:SAM-dependent methyltransferase